MSRFFTAIVVAWVANLVLPVSALATSIPRVYTFDTPSDLTNNFFTNVIAGDSRTEWRPGYVVHPPYPKSDGGFAHFNEYNTGNSLAFKDQPNLLNSFEISPQYYEGGYGVPEAIAAGLNYHLTLYNNDLEPIYSADLLTNSTGAWDKLTFNLPGVYAIAIAKRRDGAADDGWWPNIDNIRVNYPIPEPSTLALAALSALGLLIAVRPKR